MGRRGRAAGLTWNARLRNLASILRTMDSHGRGEARKDIVGVDFCKDGATWKADRMEEPPPRQGERGGSCGPQEV